jgi:hypothetical protein
VPHETQFGEVDERGFDYRGIGKDIGKDIVFGLGAIDRGLQHADAFAIRLSCLPSHQLP